MEVSRHLHAPAALSSENDFPYPLDMRLGGQLSPVNAAEKRKNFGLSGIEPGPSIPQSFVIPTPVSWTVPRVQSLSSFISAFVFDSEPFESAVLLLGYTETSFSDMNPDL
jgi:hypothetical protein